VSAAAFAKKSLALDGAAEAQTHQSYEDAIPHIVRAELNAYADREVLARMRHLARKKRMREPNITDEEMADYLALAEGYRNFEEWLRVRRAQTVPFGSSGSLKWLAGILAVVGLLTAGLVAAIAVSAL